MSNLTLIDILKTIEDDRDPQGREYKLWEVLFVSILSLLSNGKTYKDIHTFAEVNLEKLKEHFHIKWKRVPDQSAIRKIIVRQNPEAFEKAFRLYSTQQIEDKDSQGGERHICFDGKSLNGSFSHTKDTRAVRVFNAFCATKEIVLAHIPLSSEKDHEIPALQKFLQSLNLKGIVITADALHCKKKLLK